MTAINVYLFIPALLVYAVAMNLYLVVFLRRSQKMELWASRCLWVAWLTHTAALAARWVESGHAPLATQFETLSFYAWGLNLLYLVLETSTGYRALGAFVTPVSFGLLLAASMMQKDVEPLAPALQSLWLPIHVSVSFLGYAAMTLAAGGGAVYLLQERQLKSKRPLALYYLLPPLETIDYLINWLVKAGFPLMTLSLVTGALWANHEWGTPWTWDPKLNMSAVMWMVYLAFFCARSLAAWRGRKTAWLVLIGFVLILASYAGSGLLGATVHGGTFSGQR